MLLRSLVTPLVILVVVALQLAACNGDPRHKAAIDEMDHRHTLEMERIGGGSGGGSGGSM